MAVQNVSVCISIIDLDCKGLDELAVDSSPIYPVVTEQESTHNAWNEE